MNISAHVPSSTFIRDFYARMLLTRVVDEHACKLHEEGRVGFVASCRGHEAAQVGSAVCIEVGKDFTLPYYRDLGVVLTIGMTPYEIFRTYLQAYDKRKDTGSLEQNKHSRAENGQAMLHWGYHKHNMVAGLAPVATQILHAAGIAFACKLRKAPLVTVAYCGDGATAEPDFHEGITFAAQHQLPVIFICEQVCDRHHLSLPVGLEDHDVDGTDIIAVYSAMQAAMQHAREGHGPVLLQMKVHRSEYEVLPLINTERQDDPLLRCQRYLEERGAWDEEWALQLRVRIVTEVESAMRDALRDISRSISIQRWPVPSLTLDACSGQE